MDKNINKIYKYSIRKFKVGVGSAIVGLGLVFAGQEAMASEEKTIVKQEVTPVQNQVSASQEVMTKVEAPVVLESTKVQAPLAAEVKPNVEINTVVSQEPVKEEKIEPKEVVEEKAAPQTEEVKPVAKSEVVEAPLVKEAEIAESVVNPTEGTGFRNTGTNTQVANEVYTAVEQDLKAVDLNTSPTIANQLAPARISAIDVVNKRLEISRTTGRGILDVPQEEAEAALKAEAIGKLNLDEGFAAAKNDLENLVKGAVNDAVRLAPQTSAPTLISKITDNKEAFLLGAAYINKYYDLQFGATNTKDILKTNPSFYGGSQSALDFLIALGKQNNQEMSITNTVNTYNKLFLNKVSNKASIPEFLEYNNRISNPTQSIQDWFVKETNAYISEVKSQEPTKQNSAYRIYDVLKNNTHLNYNLLPLLAVSENSIYALSNTAGVTFGIVDAYVNKKADDATQARQLTEFKDRLDKANATQQNFVDFWYRVAKPETHVELEKPTMTIDTLLKRTDEVGGDPRNRWSAQTGPNAAIGVEEFIAPMGLYANYVQAGGEAAGNSVRLFLTRALETNGLTTYAHELTHIYEDKVWMAQDVRDGLLAEFYARGLYEPYQYSTEPYFNINTMFEVTDKEKVYNGSPSRFESADDLKEYMSGIFDVLYTLDLLEAEEVLNKSAEDKKWWFSKIQLASTNKQYPGTGAYVHKANEVIALDDATANKLKSVNDLVDNDIIAERTPIKSYKNKGHFENNDYYSVPLYSSNYAALENDKGVSGDYQTRRMAYELLAQYGYYEGMVPYISNQYKKDAEAAGKVLSDEFIFDKIFKGQYADAKAFKKDMLEIRKNKLDKLKPVTISYNNQTHTIDSLDKLKALFKEAVGSDLRDRPNIAQQFAYNVRNVEKLKAAIYKAYLNDTNEFRDSIYRESLADTNEPTTTAVKTTWTNGYVAPAEEIVKNAVTIDNKLVKSKVLVPAESSQSEVTVLVTYTDGSTDKVKVPVSIDPVTKQETTARSTRFERNDNLDFGQRETVTGKDGSFENVFTYVLENGRFVEKVSKQNEVAAIDDVVKVGTKPKVETVSLPKGTEYQADETKDFGFENTVEGKDGQEVITTTYTMDARGNVTANQPTTTRTEPVNTVVVKGTKEKVETKVLAKGTEYQADETKDFGFENTVEGKDGQEVITTTYSMDAQGNVIANQSTTTRVEAVNTVIIKGTKSTTRVEETSYIVNRIDSKDLKVGTERVQTKGQNGIVNHVTTYVLNPQTGEVVPTVTRVLVQEKIDEVILVGILETAKGTPAFVEDLKPLEIPGKPVFEKGEPLREADKPSLELPKVETAKGESLKEEALKEILIDSRKGDSIREEDKPSLELPKVETAKGESLKEEALKEILIDSRKGDSIREEDKPSLELPKVETAKGESLKEESLKEILIDLRKGDSLREEDKPSLELPKVETAKGESLKEESLKEILIDSRKVDSIREEDKPSLELPKVETAKGESLKQDTLKVIKLESQKGLELVREEKPTLDLLKPVFMKGDSLIQDERPKVELVKSSYSKKELRKPVLESIKKLENSVGNEVGKNVLPKTSSADTGNDVSISITLSSLLLAAGLIQRRRRKNK